MTTTQSGGKLYIGTSFCVVGFDDDHSGSDGSQETEAPIVYASLQEWHLDQVHDLLARVFWSGIESTSSQTSAFSLLTGSSKRLSAVPTGTLNGHSHL